MKLRLAISAVLLATPLFTACTQRNLFAESDPADRKLKYWRDDSATRSEKNRQQAQDWGFGYPSGSGFQ